MKVAKYELVRAIDKVKSVVQKNEKFPALAGALVNKGYLIGSNTELTVQVKLQGSEQEYFIIPMKAFDLIKNLPEGEVDVSENEKHIVTIKMDKIKNSYQSHDPKGFAFQKNIDEEASGMTVNGEKLMVALSHVIYAAADNDANVAMTGVYFEGTEKGMNLVALDGHVVAWDCIESAGGVSDAKLIVPKEAAKKLASMGVSDDIEITYTKNDIQFRNDEYMIYSRLINGKYFAYSKMFSETELTTIIARKELIGALTRAKMCMDDNRPVVFNLQGNELKLNIKEATIDYEESLLLQEEMEKPLVIGFNSKLLLEALKSFGCENIILNFSGPKFPMVIEAEDSDMKAMVLPVVLK